MLLRVEVHPGILLGSRVRCFCHATAATRSRGGLDEYQRHARDRRPVAVPAESEKTRLGGGPRRRALDLAREVGRCINLTKLFSGSAAFFCCSSEGVFLRNNPHQIRKSTTA